MPRSFNWPKIILGLTYALIFVVGFVISYAGLTMSKIFVKNPLRNIIPTPNAYTLATPKPADQVEPVKQDKGTYNVLLLGFGGAGHEGSLLTDSVILTHVNVNTHKVTFISVPRDLWVSGNHKVNAAGIVGFANAEPVITSVTGLPINYFVSVDFGGFSKIIDILGGITADTPVAFDDPFYPIIGQWYLDWIFGLHLLSNPFVVMPFNFGAALTLVIFTFVVGYVMGWVFALIWNRLQKGK